MSLTEGRELISSVGGPLPFLVGMLVAGPPAEEPGGAAPRIRVSVRRWAAFSPAFCWALSGRYGIQNDLGLISWSGLMFAVSVFPLALLTGYAYERAGVAASIAVHLGVNGTMAVLGVSSPVAQASVAAVQIVVVLTLLATKRERRETDLPVGGSCPRSPPVAIAHAHPPGGVSERSAQAGPGDADAPEAVVA
ncbi:hypothetical protein [Streptomyces sp. 150FB]|uniref:hypothetical protein n=1 Tax=Streptomyces sp. 150FB TaxID=1576605 RepID=UPI001237099A|nr:hypothetical protein [Streptomyces sp. 150FB]